jgi:predicted nucleic-acid-binding Zn-ribbon protein
MPYTIGDMTVKYSEKSFLRHLRFYYGKHYGSIKTVSRKTKKAIIGTKMKKKHLKSLINSVEIIEQHEYYGTEIYPYQFCPKCGCKDTRSSGSMAEYPERWERIYCLRCGYLVCESDNSPYVHVLQLMCGSEKDEFDPKYWG